MRGLVNGAHVCWPTSSCEESYRASKDRWAKEAQVKAGGRPPVAPGPCVGFTEASGHCSGTLWSPAGRRPGTNRPRRIAFAGLHCDQPDSNRPVMRWILNGGCEQMGWRDDTAGNMVVKPTALMWTYFHELWFKHLGDFVLGMDHICPCLDRDCSAFHSGIFCIHVLSCTGGLIPRNYWGYFPTVGELELKKA